MLWQHAELAESMGMSRKNIVIPEMGQVIEMNDTSLSLGEQIPTGGVLVDGLGIGDVGNVVLRDRKHLAEDGMIVVVVTMSGEDGSVVSGPDIITRGFVYVKESEQLMDELRGIACQTLYSCEQRHLTDWATIKSEVKGDLSSFLYKKTKRNPMILPVIMEV